MSNYYFFSDFKYDTELNVKPKMKFNLNRNILSVTISLDQLVICLAKTTVINLKDDNYDARVKT